MGLIISTSDVWKFCQNLTSHRYESHAFTFLKFSILLLNLDFHWYRLDSGGRWSHKPGETAPKNTDNNNNPIFDPRLANTGFYEFVAFMFVDKNSVKIL